MSEYGSANFSNIIRKIIKKSLFTERQIEIILNQRNLSQNDYPQSQGHEKVHRRSEMSKLDQEEKEILEAFERGDIKAALVVYSLSRLAREQTSSRLVMSLIV